MLQTVQGNVLFQGLTSILEKRISPITTHAILHLLMEKEHIDPHTLSGHELERLFQSKIFGRIRLYCDQEQLTEIMLDLSELVDMDDDIALAG